LCKRQACPIETARYKMDGSKCSSEVRLSVTSQTNTSQLLRSMSGSATTQTATADADVDAHPPSAAPVPTMRSCNDTCQPIPSRSLRRVGTGGTTTPVPTPLPQGQGAVDRMGILDAAATETIPPVSVSGGGANGDHCLPTLLCRDDDGRTLTLDAPSRST